MIIPTDKPVEFNKGETEQEKRPNDSKTDFNNTEIPDIDFSTSPNFTCVDTSDNTCFDSKLDHGAAASYQTTGIGNGQIIGPNCVQTDSVELEGQIRRLIDNTIKEAHHFIADTFTPHTLEGRLTLKARMCLHHLPLHVTLEPNEHFISFLVRDSTPLTHPSRNISLEGHINGKTVTYLIDTAANISAIRADIWRQIPQMMKHPPAHTHIISISAVNGQSIPVLGQIELPFSINDKTYPFSVLIIESIAYDVILGRDFLES